MADAKQWRVTTLGNRKEQRERPDVWARFGKGKEVFLCVAVWWRQKYKITMCITLNQRMECVVHKMTI
jgi:hypothetical protein